MSCCDYDNWKSIQPSMFSINCRRGCFLAFSIRYNSTPMPPLPRSIQATVEVLQLVRTQTACLTLTRSSTESLRKGAIHIERRGALQSGRGLCLFTGSRKGRLAERSTRQLGSFGLKGGVGRYLNPKNWVT
eukprot:scaffold363_cov331-Pavlova_lutheri.AAC.30